METPQFPSQDLHLALLDKTRTDMLKLLEGLTPARVYAQPAGFRNSLLWNLGHVVVTHQVICYEQSGLPLRVPHQYLTMFRKGTHPGQWTEAVDPEEVKRWALESIRLFREDLAANIFKTFAPYKTSWGLHLANLPDILSFVAWHESLHYGVMSAMRKLV